VIINLIYLIITVELSLNNSIVTSKLSIAAAAMSLSCSIMITLSSTLYQIYSVASSNLAQLILGAWILTDIVTIRTSWLSDQNRVPAALGLAGLVLKATLLLTEELPKKKSLRSPYSAYPPEARSGIYSKIFLIWLNPLMLRGLVGAPLKLPDLWACDTELSAEVLTARLHHLWSQQLHPSTPEKSSRRRKNIFFVLAWEFRWLCFLPMPTRVLQAGFMFAQPFLIQKTLEWYGGSLDAKSWDVGYGILGAYAVVYIGIAVSSPCYADGTLSVISNVNILI
jgi:ATP-binding cassette, subfamily C (CFTR/MRP), member 1